MIVWLGADGYATEMEVDRVLAEASRWAIVPADLRALLLSDQQREGVRRSPILPAAVEMEFRRLLEHHLSRNLPQCLTRALRLTADRFGTSAANSTAFSSISIESIDIGGGPRVYMMVHLCTQGSEAS